MKTKAEQLVSRIQEKEMDPLDKKIKELTDYAKKLSANWDKAAKKKDDKGVEQYKNAHADVTTQIAALKKQKEAKAK